MPGWRKYHAALLHSMAKTHWREKAEEGRIEFGHREQDEKGKRPHTRTTLLLTASWLLSVPGWRKYHAALLHSMAKPTKSLGMVADFLRADSEGTVASTPEMDAYRVPVLMSQFAVLPTCQHLVGKWTGNT